MTVYWCGMATTEAKTDTYDSIDAAVEQPSSSYRSGPSKTQSAFGWLKKNIFHYYKLDEIPKDKIIDLGLFGIYNVPEGYDMVRFNCGKAKGFLQVPWYSRWKQKKETGWGQNENSEEGKKPEPLETKVRFWEWGKKLRNVRRKHSQKNKGPVYIFKGGVEGPGNKFLLSLYGLYQKVAIVDTRLRTDDVPREKKLLTKDMAQVGANAVFHYWVKDSYRAVVGAQDFRYTLDQRVLSFLKDVVSDYDADELCKLKGANMKFPDPDGFLERIGISEIIVETKSFDFLDELETEFSQRPIARAKGDAIRILAEAEKDASHSVKELSDILEVPASEVYGILKQVEISTNASKGEGSQIAYAIPDRLWRAFEQVVGKANKQSDTV